jgi:hypothetical protein
LREGRGQKAEGRRRRQKEEAEGVMSGDFNLKSKI